jgi:hypothetical protein
MNANTATDLFKSLPPVSFSDILSIIQTITLRRIEGL